MPKKQTAPTSKYKGVSRHSLGKKFCAQYKYKGKTTYLGLYLTEVHAAIAYDNGIHALKSEVGETAHTYNFGDPADPRTKLVREGALADVPAEILIAPQARKKFHQAHVVNEEPMIYEEPNSLVKISGISWYAKRQIWKMSIQVDKHKYYMGRADTYAEAVQKYLTSLKEFRVRFPDNKSIIVKINTIEDALRTNTLYYKQPGEVEPWTQDRHGHIQSEEEDILSQENVDTQFNDHAGANYVAQPNLSDVLEDWDIDISSFLAQANNSPRGEYPELLSSLPTTPPPLARRTPDQETEADIFGADSDSMFFLWNNAASNTPRLSSTSPVMNGEETIEDPLTDIDRLLQFQL